LTGIRPGNSARPQIPFFLFQSKWTRKSDSGPEFPEFRPEGATKSQALAVPVPGSIEANTYFKKESKSYSIVFPILIGKINAKKGRRSMTKGSGVQTVSAKV